MGWTDERVERLKKLWSDGLSASQIAGELGGVTRNAVIGKVHRLGLSGRAKAPMPQAQRAKTRPPRPATGQQNRSEPTLTTVGNTALKIDLVPVTRPQIEVQPRVY